jgi:hypothetical protein
MAAELQRWLVTLDTLRGLVSVDVPTTLGREGAERRARWVLISQRTYGDLDDITVVGSEQVAPQQHCHDCHHPISESNGPAVMVFERDGHGGVRLVADRDNPKQRAVRCMTCNDKIQHPERRANQ